MPNSTLTFLGYHFTVSPKQRRLYLLTVVPAMLCLAVASFCLVIVALKEGLDIETFLAFVLLAAVSWELTLKNPEGDKVFALVPWARVRKAAGVGFLLFAIYHFNATSQYWLAGVLCANTALRLLTFVGKRMQSRRKVEAVPVAARPLATSAKNLDVVDVPFVESSR